MIAKCPCEHCGDIVEFNATENAEGGQSIECPHCGRQTVLNTSSVQSPKFFVWQNEQQQGPFEQETIQQMISEWKITSETLVCPEDGGLDWTPAKKLFFPGSGSSWGDWENAESWAKNQAEGEKRKEILRQKSIAAAKAEEQMNAIRDVKVLENYYASGKRLSEDQMNLIRDARGRVIIRTFRALFCFALFGLGVWFLISGLIDLNSVANDQNGTIFQQQFSVIEIIGGGLLIGIVLLVLAVGKKAK